VAETLRGRILNQAYRPGSILPSEKELAKEFGVSLITIRKAMDLLVREDLVARRRGVGTRVLASNHGRLPIKLSGNFRDWFDSVSGKLQGLEAQVLEMGLVECPERVARALGVEEGAVVWRMKRVRRYKGEAISYYVNYGPKDLANLVTPSDFAKRSFLEVFQERFKVNSPVWNSWWKQLSRIWMWQASSGSSSDPPYSSWRTSITRKKEGQLR